MIRGLHCYGHQVAVSYQIILRIYTFLNFFEGSSEAVLELFNAGANPLKHAKDGLTCKSICFIKIKF